MTQDLCCIYYGVLSYLRQNVFIFEELEQSDKDNAILICVCSNVFSSDYYFAE